MKKIIFINNLSFGGAERVVSRLFLDERIRKTASLWTLNSKEDYETNYCRKISFESVNVVFSYFKALVHLLFLKKNDLLQAHLNNPIILSGFAKLFNRRFVLQTVHCFSYSGFYLHKKSIFWLFHKSLMSRALKASDHHIFKSKEMLSDFEGFFGWMPRSYEVIYNPYDVEEILSMSNQELNSSEIDDKAFNIVVVGRLASSKRPFDILEIASRFKGLADFHFLGDGVERERLETICQLEGLDNVKFHGRKLNPFPYINICDIYLSCSESEGFPNTLIESMILGKLCIHSNCATGPKEILANDWDYRLKDNFDVVKRGILFNTGDIKGACRAINYAIDNFDELDGKFNDETFLQNISLNMITDKYYQALIN
ncbi:glycosyltransferase [Vibrio breoganii]